jgi:hypothetical protein
LHARRRRGREGSTQEVGRSGGKSGRDRRKEGKRALRVGLEREAGRAGERDVGKGGTGKGLKGRGKGRDWERTGKGGTEERMGRQA